MAERGLELILALIIGALLVIGAFVVFGQSTASDSDLGPATSQGETPETTAIPTIRDTLVPSSPGDPDQFVQAWRTHLSTDHALDGFLEIYEVAPGAAVDIRSPIGIPFSSISVRRAILDDRELDQVGTSALSIGPSGQRSCERQQSGVYLCTDPAASPSLSARLALIERRIDGDDSEYELWEDEGCWVVSAREPTTSGIWGQLSRWCFDETVGVLIERTTWRGSRLERFFAEDLRTKVTETDLAPG